MASPAIEEFRAAQRGLNEQRLVMLEVRGLQDALVKLVELRDEFGGFTELVTTLGPPIGALRRRLVDLLGRVD